MSEKLTDKELRELDAWIAENIFDWKYRKLNRSDVFNVLLSPEAIRDGFGKFEPDEHQPNQPNPLPYTTASDASMKVLKKCLGIQEPALAMMTNGRYRISWYDGFEKFSNVDADTLELAICQFAKQLFSK